MTEPGPNTADGDALADEGRSWIVRLTSGAATQADAEALRKWKARSPAHAEAFREAVALWKALEIAANELRDEQHEVFDPKVTVLRRRMDRRVLLGGGLAAAAAAAVVMAVKPPMALWPSLSEWDADYRTAKGEQRQVALATGVSLQLNTLTSIAVRKSGDGPEIELLSGETAVTTTRSGASPFTAIAGKGRVVTAAANYLLRYDGDEACVTCVSGAVQVAIGEASQQLAPRQQITYRDGNLGSPVATDLSVATAWQSGLLVFRHTPLAQVIAEVNRYRRGQIILTNSALGRRTFNGVFHIDHLDDVVGEVRQALGANVTQIGDIVLVG